MSTFTELTAYECQDVNGGGPILAGAIIVGGIIVIGAATFAVGYGLAMWLG